MSTAWKSYPEEDYELMIDWFNGHIETKEMTELIGKSYRAKGANTSAIYSWIMPRFRRYVAEGRITFK